MRAAFRIPPGGGRAATLARLIMPPCCSSDDSDSSQQGSAPVTLVDILRRHEGAAKAAAKKQTGAPKQQRGKLNARAAATPSGAALPAKHAATNKTPAASGAKKATSSATAATTPSTATIQQWLDKCVAQVAAAVSKHRCTSRMGKGQCTGAHAVTEAGAQAIQAMCTEFARSVPVLRDTSASAAVARALVMHANCSLTGRPPAAQQQHALFDSLEVAPPRSSSSGGSTEGARVLPSAAALLLWAVIEHGGVDAADVVRVLQDDCLFGAGAGRARARAGGAQQSCLAGASAAVARSRLCRGAQLLGHVLHEMRDVDTMGDVIAKLCTGSHKCCPNLALRCLAAFHAASHPMSPSSQRRATPQPSLPSQLATKEPVLLAALFAVCNACAPVGSSTPALQSRAPVLHHALWTRADVRRDTAALMRRWRHALFEAHPSIAAVARGAGSGAAPDAVAAFVFAAAERCTGGASGADRSPPLMALGAGKRCDAEQCCGPRGDLQPCLSMQAALGKHFVAGVCALCLAFGVEFAYEQVLTDAFWAFAEQAAQHCTTLHVQGHSGAACNAVCMQAIELLGLTIRVGQDEHPAQGGEARPDSVAQVLSYLVSQIPVLMSACGSDRVHALLSSALARCCSHVRFKAQWQTIADLNRQLARCAEQDAGFGTLVE